MDIRIAIQTRSFIKDFFIVEIASLLIALVAPLAIKLPFTPVPIAWAAPLCLLLGATLGKNRGILAVIAYLVQGAMGLPVFALGGSGLLHLLGPKGGYLLGYAAGSYLVGFLLEKRTFQSSLGTLGALIAGMSTVFILGMLQLSLYVGWPQAFTLGFLPFAFLDLCKVFVVFGLLKLRRSRG